MNTYETLMNFMFTLGSNLTISHYVHTDIPKSNTVLISKYQIRTIQPVFLPNYIDNLNL